MMAKFYMEGQDVRALPKTCYVCHKEITAVQAFTLELRKEPAYRHIDCEPNGGTHIHTDVTRK